MKIKKSQVTLKESVVETPTEEADVIEEATSTITESEETVVKAETDAEGKPESPAKIERKIKNALTDVLDAALDDAKHYIKTRQFYQNSNVLVEGLPGSSKTATINEWAKANGIKLYKLNAKNPEIELLINGAPAIADDDEGQKKIVKAYSNVLNKLQEKNTVLFLDELNRQVKEYLRGSLLTLLEERACDGPGEDGTVHFPNLLFTIAAINPPGKADPGVTKLLPAERRRFQYYVRFDSDKDTAKEYVLKHYDRLIIESYHEYDGDIKNPEYLAELEEWLRTQDLGLYLLKASWNFDGDDKYKMLYDTGSKLLCQAAVTELLAMSRGDKERFLKKLASYRFLDEDTAALTRALDRYYAPTFELLVARKEKELGMKLADFGIAAPKPATPAPEKKVPAKKPVPVADAEPDDLDMGDDAGDEMSVRKRSATSAADKKKKIAGFEF